VISVVPKTKMHGTLLELLEQTKGGKSYGGSKLLAVATPQALETLKASHRDITDIIDTVQKKRLRKLEGLVRCVIINSR
jgi:hypothetical protein